MGVKYMHDGGSFQFDSGFGFTGSATSTRPKNHPNRGADEFGDGLAKGGAACMAKGGTVAKAIGGKMPPIVAVPVARAGVRRAEQKIAPTPVAVQRPAIAQSMVPALTARPTVRRSGMAKGGQVEKEDFAKGGKFIQKGIKHPGRMKAYAKKLGVSTHEAMVKASHSSDPSLRSAGNLGLRLTGGDLSRHRKSKK